MADVHKLVGKSGLISSGAAGFLKGVAGRQREDRESQASREKDALSAFIELRKEGWTVGDENKGITGGEGIHLEGFGILVPPEVEGEAGLDIAKALKERALAEKLGAEQKWFERRPGETRKGLITWTDSSDKTKQVHLPPGTQPPSGYIKHEVGKSTQGLVTWINRNKPKEPVKRLLPGEDPGPGYVKYAEFERTQEKFAQQKIEWSKQLRREMATYDSQIGKLKSYIVMMQKTLKPGEEDSAILKNMKREVGELEMKRDFAKRTFVTVMGNRPLPAPPSGQGGKREPSMKERDEVLREALDELDLTDKELTIDELNKLKEQMAIISDSKGFIF